MNKKKRNKIWQKKLKASWSGRAHKKDKINQLDEKRKTIGIGRFEW